MKRIYIILAALFVFVSVNSESYEDSIRHQIPIGDISVLGIKIGMSKEKCKQIISREFDRSPIELVKNFVSFEEIRIGDDIYKSISMDFINNKIHGIFLESDFDDDNSIIGFMVDHNNYFSNKYGLRNNFTNEETAEVVYRYGYSPFDPNNALMVMVVSPGVNGHKFLLTLTYYLTDDQSDIGGL